jgi:hypothetical protein
MSGACMSPDEYAAWSEANGRLLSNRADSPCRDCTPLFHRDMVAGGMCDGTPLPEQPPGRGGRPPLDPIGRRLYWAEHRRASRERARALA